MFNSIIKCTFLVCMGFLCLFGFTSTQAEIHSPPLLEEMTPIDDIIVTITGLEILIESADDDNIILGADLYDSTQQVVVSDRSYPAVNSLTLDISNLSSGYYVLQVQTTTGIESFQIQL